MLLNKANVAVRAFTPNKKKGWPVLGGVHVTSAKTEATDGSVLVQVSTPNDSPSDYPAIDGIDAGSNGADIIIDRDSAEDMERAIPKNAVRPILGNVALDTTVTDGCVRVAAIDTHNVQTITAHTIDAAYPDTESVWPEGKPVATARVGAKHLENVAKFMARYGDGGIVIELGTEGTPVVMRAKCETGQTIDVLIAQKVES